MTRVFFLPFISDTNYMCLPLRKILWNRAVFHLQFNLDLVFFLPLWSNYRFIPPLPKLFHAIFALCTSRQRLLLNLKIPWVHSLIRWLLYGAIWSRFSQFAEMYIYVISRSRVNTCDKCKSFKTLLVIKLYRSRITQWNRHYQQVLIQNTHS